MNEDIEVPLEDEQQSTCESLKQTKFEQLPPGVATAALDPRSYAFVPANWTNKIRAAGQQSRKSETIGSLLGQHNFFHQTVRSEEDISQEMGSETI